MARVVIEIEDIFGTEQFKLKSTPEASVLVGIHKSGNTLTNAQSAALRFIAAMLEESKANDPTRRKNSKIWTPS